MRVALVVLFFVGMYILLTPSRPADPIPTPDPPTPSQQQRGEAESSSAPPVPPGLPGPVTGATPKPPDTADDGQFSPSARSDEDERAGEQRTSQHGALKQGEVESGIRRELTRLGCFTGRPERNFGSRSRSALRRFVTRAKPRESATPSEALLRVMRGYPTNYCKTCRRPGQPACRLGGRPQR